MKADQSDRTVHARYEGGEIVRYDRAGKWYLETDDSRRAVGIHDAAATAVAMGAFVHFQRPGGLRFDAMVRKLRELREGK